MEHNRQDVVTLAGLLMRIMNLIRGQVENPVDLAALGEYLLMRGDMRGLDHLSQGFQGGDARAGRVLSLYLKRSQRWSEAVDIWTEMAERGSGWATIELAKYCEHRLKQPERALWWIDRTWTGLPVPEPLLKDVRKRKARLMRKLQRKRVVEQS
jgi:hypothetical protein